MGTLLQLDRVTKQFGGLVAVGGIDLAVDEGSIASVIGPNGAGKTTLFNLITGIYRPDAGAIIFRGEPITGWRPDRITALGLARTFQNIRLFGNMSVLDNVLVGMSSRLKPSPTGILLRTGGYRRSEAAAASEAQCLLRFVDLPASSEELLARNLPYGQQRRLELARALAVRPHLILLDEPTAGMNPQETADAMQLFRRLRDELGITVLLIEHDMRVVMGISDMVTVIDFGQTIAAGTPAEVRQNPDVIRAYLGDSV